MVQQASSRRSPRPWLPLVRCVLGLFTLHPLSLAPSLPVARLCLVHVRHEAPPLESAYRVRVVFLHACLVLSLSLSLSLSICAYLLPPFLHVPMWQEHAKQAALNRKAMLAMQEKQMEEAAKQREHEQKMAESCKVQ